MSFDRIWRIKLTHKRIPYASFVLHTTISSTKYLFVGIKHTQANYQTNNIIRFSLSFSINVLNFRMHDIDQRNIHEKAGWTIEWPFAINKCWKKLIYVRIHAGKKYFFWKNGILVRCSSLSIKILVGFCRKILSSKIENAIEWELLSGNVLIRMKLIERKRFMSFGSRTNVAGENLLQKKKQNQNSLPRGELLRLVNVFGILHLRPYISPFLLSFGASSFSKHQEVYLVACWSSFCLIFFPSKFADYWIEILFDKEFVLSLKCSPIIFLMSKMTLDGTKLIQIHNFI